MSLRSLQYEMQIQWEVFITETQSLHPILPIQSCKWVRYNFQTHFFLYTLLQINYGWEYQWHIITILFLVFELFFNQKQIIWYNSFTWSSPTMTIPASWFLIQILHIYKKLFFFFLSFFSNNNVKDWFFYSLQLNLLKR